MQRDILDDRKTLYLPCFCGDSDHLLTLTYDIFEEPNEPEDMLIFINMNHYLHWWQRILPGLRYILGKKPRNCHFQDIYLNRKKVYELKEFIDEYLKE